MKLQSTFARILGGVVLALCFATAHAQDASKTAPYFVSAVLKKAGATDSNTRIVQGMVLSDSQANAQLVFAILATKQFPDHVVGNVLASSFEQLMSTLPGAKEEKKPAPAEQGQSL